VPLAKGSRIVLLRLGKLVLDCELFETILIPSEAIPAIKSAALERLRSLELMTQLSVGLLIKPDPSTIIVELGCQADTIDGVADATNGSSTYENKAPVCNDES